MAILDVTLLMLLMMVMMYISRMRRGSEMMVFVGPVLLTCSVSARLSGVIVLLRCHIVSVGSGVVVPYERRGIREAHSRCSENEGRRLGHVLWIIWIHACSAILVHGMSSEMVWGRWWLIGLSNAG